MEDTSVVSLFDGGDARCTTLLEAVNQVIYERGANMPVPAVLGVLRLVELNVLRNGGVL